MKGLFLMLLFLPLFSYAQMGVITTIAGTGTGTGYSGDGGPATAASFYTPRGVKCDRAGNIYVCNGMWSERKISPSGVVTRFAGQPSTWGYSGDGGMATAAILNFPRALAIDKKDNVYIFDDYNNRIRKVDTGGRITTFAGGGSRRSVELPATDAIIRASDGCIDRHGNLVFYDRQSWGLKCVDTAGILHSVTRNDSVGFSGDGGPATNAKLGNLPASLCADQYGNIYIYDGENYRIRKIDTNGIITTIAGTGTAGYTGDGGPATAATISGRYDYTICFDTLMGELYFFDVGNHVIRKIDPSGIISTVAGNGSGGYSPDGTPPLSAMLGGPYFFFDENHTLVFSEISSSMVRKFGVAGSLRCDSFHTYFNIHCSGISIYTRYAGFRPGVYLKTLFGDGTSDSSAVSSLFTSINHNYVMSGNYTIKQYLYYSGALIDSASTSYSHKRCTTVDFSIYREDSTNCSKSYREKLLSIPVLVQVDSNSVTIDTVSCIGSMTYYKTGGPGDVYNFQVLSVPPGSSFYCPATGFFTDTIRSTTYRSASIAQSFKCGSIISADAQVYLSIAGTGSHTQRGLIYCINNQCTPTSGQVKLTFNPRFSLHSSSVTPATTGSGYAIWNYSDLSSTSPFQISYQLEIAGTRLAPGETVTSGVEITSSVTDVDTSNNVVIRVDTSRSSYDPNEVLVNPGCLNTIAAPQQLEYTIHFENMGNDTAFNIHVLDTLSDKLDPTSLRMVLSSHAMTVSRIKDSVGHTTVKFDFPNINLLDSSHHGFCDGTIVYTIKTRAGITSTADITNRAGIYFDDNEVVLTNTAHTRIGCTVVEVPTQVKNGQVVVYPNPANDELTIENPTTEPMTLTIMDLVGRKVLATELKGQQTTIDISRLNRGIYLMNFERKDGVQVQKLTKY